jgi:hypothetical protein
MKVILLVMVLLLCSAAGCFVTTETTCYHTCSEVAKVCLNNESKTLATQRSTACTDSFIKCMEGCHKKVQK